MCQQKTVVKKIRKAGELNGYAIELVEAQMSDYVTLKRDVDSVKDSILQMKTEQAVQGGKLDLIIRRLNSPVEKERQAAAVWMELRTLFGSWKGWVVIVFFLMSVALAGEKILQLLNWLPTGV